MIGYELSKKLKNAGFPQNINTCGFVYREDERGDLIDLWPASKQCFSGQPDRYVLCPTLEELIAECEIEVRGESLYNLSRINEVEGVMWYTNWHEDFPSDSKGKTPEEAVANLWLKLNE